MDVVAGVSIGRGAAATPCGTGGTADCPPVIPEKAKTGLVCDAAPAVVKDAVRPFVARLVPDVVTSAVALLVGAV